MPKYYEDKEEDGRACGGVREDLRQCLLESRCVLQENKSPRQCLREGHCRSLQTTFFACKRSMDVHQVIFGEIEDNPTSVSSEEPCDLLAASLMN